VSSSNPFKRLAGPGLAVLLALATAGVSAQITFTVEGGRADAQPIAVVPFARVGSGPPPPEDVAQIIADDLARSGFFKPVARRDLPSQPSEPSQMVFSDWRLLGTAHVVIGQVKPIPGGKYQVSFRLMDAFKGIQITGYPYNADASKLRRTAHQIADIIFKELTGQRGAFDTRVAYVTESGRGDNRRYRLNMADSDGFGTEVLLTTDEPVMSPSWSPDGRSIAYVSLEGKQAQIYVQDVYSKKRRRVSRFPGINGAPAFSPDGRRLAMTLSKDGNPEIYVLDLASKRLDRLTVSGAIDTEPSWSPDGREIVFTSDRGGSPQIYRMPASGGDARRVTFESTYAARAHFSPDGRMLAFVHGVDGIFRIAVMDLETGGLTTLTDTYLDESPSFAPNGSMILYSTSTGQGTALAAVSTDGAIQQTLVERRGSAREPAWSPFLGQ
jgi:TolB protein